MAKNVNNKSGAKDTYYKAKGIEKKAAPKVSKPAVSGRQAVYEGKALSRFNALVEKTNFDDPRSVRKLNNAQATKVVSRMAAGKAVGAARALKVAKTLATRAGNPLVGVALIAGPAIAKKLNEGAKNTNRRPAKAGELRNPAVGYSKGGTPVRQVNKKRVATDAAKMIKPGKTLTKKERQHLAAIRRQEKNPKATGENII